MPNYTKKAIKAAFLALLDEKPLAKITVRDIVEKCGVNRNSFYYHFADIPALVEEIVTEEADEIIAAYPTVDSLETCLNAVTAFATKNKRAIRHICAGANRELFETYLWKVCRHVVAAYGQTAFSKIDIYESDRELFLRFYECECFGLVMGFLRDGMKEPGAEQIHRLCELKKGVLEEMLKRSAATKPQA